MPAPLDVDREQVRMLVLEVGVTEASRRTGIDLSTVKQWSARGGWLAHTRVPQPLPTSMQPVPVTGLVTGVTRQPADALTDVLREHNTETRVSLARATRQAAAKLEACEPEDAKNLKAVAQTAALVHGWQDGQGAGAGVVINIALLGQPAGSSEPQGIDL